MSKFDAIALMPFQEDGPKVTELQPYRLTKFTPVAVPAGHEVGPQHEWDSVDFRNTSTHVKPYGFQWTGITVFMEKDHVIRRDGRTDGITDGIIWMTMRDYHQTPRDDHERSRSLMSRISKRGIFTISLTFRTGGGVQHAFNRAVSKLLTGRPRTGNRTFRSTLHSLARRKKNQASLSQSSRHLTSGLRWQWRSRYRQNKSHRTRSRNSNGSSMRRAELRRSFNATRNRQS